MIILKCEICGFLAQFANRIDENHILEKIWQDHELKGKEHKVKEFDSDKTYDRIVKYYVEKKNFDKERANKIAEKATAEQIRQWLDAKAV